MAKRAIATTLAVRSVQGARKLAQEGNAATKRPAARGAAGARRSFRRSQTASASLDGRQTAIAEWRALRHAAQALDAQRRARRCSLEALAKRVGLSAATVRRVFRACDDETPPEKRRLDQLRARLVALRLALDAYQAPPARKQPSHPAPPTPHARRTRGYVAPRAAAPPTQPPTYRVLIVEDDPDIVAIYKLALAEAETDDAGRAARYEVTVVATGAACLAALRAAYVKQRPYDLLIMDLSLRDVHADQPHSTSRSATTATSVGTDLIATLTGAVELLPRQRLVISGMAPLHLNRVRRSLAELGAAYLSKPFDIDTLLAAAYALCSGETRRTPGLAYFT